MELVELPPPKEVFKQYPQGRYMKYLGFTPRVLHVILKEESLYSS